MFEYSNLKVNKQKLQPDDILAVLANVTSIGNVFGNEIVQLYILITKKSTCDEVNKIEFTIIKWR